MLLVFHTDIWNSETSQDSSVQMSRKTDWIEQAGGSAIGLGQRMFATDQDDYPILEVRDITLGSGVEPQAVSELPDGGPDTT